MMAEKANLKYGHELKQIPEAAKKRKQSRPVPVDEGLSVSLPADESISSASVVSQRRSDLVVAPAGQPASLPPDLQPNNAAAAGAHMFESLGCVAVGAESIGAEASTSASASASTRSSGIALSIVSSLSDAAAGAANILLPLATASPMSSSSTSASSSSTSAGVGHQNAGSGGGGAAPGGASGAQVPRKSSMKKRAPVLTMAAVSEREERDRPELSESALVNRRLSTRSLAKSLFRYESYAYLFKLTQILTD